MTQAGSVRCAAAGCGCGVYFVAVVGYESLARLHGHAQSSLGRQLERGQAAILLLLLLRRVRRLDSGDVPDVLRGDRQSTPLLLGDLLSLGQTGAIAIGLHRGEEHREGEEEGQGQGEGEGEER